MTGEELPWIMRNFGTSIHSFFMTKNMVRSVFFDSLEEWTVSISTKEERPRERKSLYSRSVKTSLSVICALWHFLGLKRTLRLRSTFLAVNSPMSR